jgi:hypothetical protein
MDFDDILADFAQKSEIECVECGKPCLGTFIKGRPVSACCGAKYQKRENKTRGRGRGNK